MARCCFLLMGVLALTSAKVTHIKRDQQVVFMGDNQASQTVATANHSKILNMTFGDVELDKSPNRTLSTLGFMNFERYNIVNTTTAHDRGYLAANDTNCAISSSNAIFSVPTKYAGPSIFHSNTSALHALNTSQYFDFIKFTAKPLGPGPQFASMEIHIWQIDEDKQPINTDSLFMSWQSDRGFFLPFDLEPRMYFEGWGEKVNWVEMSGAVYLDDGTEMPWPFCVDEVVLEFFELDE